MADTWTIYTTFVTRQFNGNAIDFDTDTLKVALCTASYTPAQDTHDFFDDITNELAASGNYTAGGESLASKTVTQDDTNDGMDFDAADLTWTALTQSAAIKYAILYKSTGTASTSGLIAYLTFETAQEPNGSDFILSWNAGGILTAIEA